MGLNRVSILGRALGAPELKYLTNGGAVLNARLLVVDSYEKDGESHETQTEIPLTLWGKSAEKYVAEVAEGDAVYAEGRITNRKRQVDSGREFDNPSVSVTLWKKLAAEARAEAKAAVPAKRKPSEEDESLPF